MFQNTLPALLMVSYMIPMIVQETESVVYMAIGNFNTFLTLKIWWSQENVLTLQAENN